MPRDRQLLARAVRKAVESLESRVLMSASVDLKGGVLDIVGTNSADTIVVSYASGDRGTLEVSVNNQTVGVATRKVSSIRIEAGRGDDSITVLQLNGAIDKPATIYAGRGNDTVVGGSGDDAIYGGKGDDQIGASAGKDTYDAGGGNDTYNGAPIPTSATAAAASSLGKASPFALTIPTYTVSDLGILPGGAGDRGVWNIANTTNSTVGFSVINDTGNQKVPHGMYKPNGKGRQIDLGTLGGSVSGSTSIGYDINVNDEMVGESRTTPGGARHGFYYSTFMRDIGSIGGGDTVAYGINDFLPTYAPATIVGESNGSAFYKVGPGGRFNRVPDANGQGLLRGRFREVNSDDYNIPFPDGIGDIMVGFDAGVNQAVVYDEVADSTFDLSTIRGAVTSEAFDVNTGVGGPNNYTVVGVSGENTPVETAFWWRNNPGAMTALPTPAGDRSKAYGVRDADPVTDLVKIVGRTQHVNNNVIVSHAAEWIESTTGVFQLIDLQALTSGGTGRVLTEAHAINTNDWIVAVGTVPTDNFQHAFLLTPGVPPGLGQNSITFSGGFIKPVVVNQTNPKLVFNFFGVGDFTVAKNNVQINLLTVDLQRGNLPSEGIVDFTFNNAGLSRVVTNQSAGIGKFSGIAEAFATLSDGTTGDFLVSFQGTTSRSHHQDIIQGSFVAVSSRGKVLKQGGQSILYGSFKHA